MKLCVHNFEMGIREESNFYFSILDWRIQNYNQIQKKKTWMQINKW